MKTKYFVLLALSTFSAMALDSGMFDENVERFELVSSDATEIEYISSKSVVEYLDGSTKLDTEKDNFWMGNKVYLDKQTNSCLKVEQDLVEMRKKLGIELPHLRTQTTSIECPTDLNAI